MKRILYGLVALFGVLVVMVGAAGAVSAEQGDWEPELSVQLVDCQVTVAADSIPHHVSSGMRTAGLAIQVNGETVAYTPPEAMGDGAYEFEESLSFGPVVDTDVVEFRWFAGPDRTDLPAWNLDHPELNEIIAQVEYPEGEFVRHWDARDDAEFVNWYAFGEITGCPEETGTPSPGASPTASPTTGAGETPSATPEAATLPETSGIRLLPVLLIGGAAFIGAGAGLYVLGRRRMDHTT